jgi:hypothetical protein
VLRRDISLFLEWRNGDMSGEQMKSVANIFEQMLAQVLSPGNTAISQLNLFSENDLQRIRHWNSHTPKLYDRTIHDAIHDQALSGPDREAVSAWDGSLTFSELDGLASKLACHLRMQGVGPEVRVALCFDKSVSSALFLLSSLSLSQRSHAGPSRSTQWAMWREYVCDCVMTRALTAARNGTSLRCLA